VVVYLREAQVFVRKMTQFGEGSVYVDRAVRYGFEEGL
jgi:hypothetical protein